MPGEHEVPAAGSGSDAARATTGRSVLTGGLWYVASYGIPQGYSLVLSIVAARFLHPDGMGRQSFIAFISLTLTTMVSSSVYVALMRYIGETAGRGRQELLPGLLWWAWRIEAVAALLAGGGLAAVAVLGATPRGAWVFAGVVSAAGILHTVPTAVLIGLQRFRQAAAVGLVTGLVATVVVTIVLWQGGGITGMFAAEAAVGLVNLAWTGTLARRSLSGLVGAGADPSGYRELRRSVARFALLSSIGLFLELVVATRSEFFFLARFSSDSQIAFYSIAFSAMAALRLVPRALGGATSPAFATLFGAGAFDRIRSGYSRSLRLLLLASLPLTALGVSLGPELIEEVYGHDYTGAGHPAQILLLVFPLVALSSLSNSLLAGLGRIRLPLIANALAAAIDLGLAAALIPRLDARGAAIANAGGQGTYALIVLVFSGRLVRPVDWRPAVAVRVACAAAGAGGAAWAVVALVDGFSGIALASVASVATLALLGALLRIISWDDARWLENAFGRKSWYSVGRLAALWSERPPDDS